MLQLLQDGRRVYPWTCGTALGYHASPDGVGIPLLLCCPALDLAHVPQGDLGPGASDYPQGVQCHGDRLLCSLPCDVERIQGLSTHGLGADI